jgi:signal transduction histidine kinase
VIEGSARDRDDDPVEPPSAEHPRYTATHLAIGAPDAAPPPPRSRASSLTWRITAVLLVAMGLTAALHHHTIESHRHEHMRLRTEARLRLSVGMLARRLGLGDADELAWPAGMAGLEGPPMHFGPSPPRPGPRPDAWMGKRGPRGFRPPPGPPGPPGPGRRRPPNFLVFDLDGEEIFRPFGEPWDRGVLAEAIRHLPEHGAVWILRSEGDTTAFARFGSDPEALVLGVRHELRPAPPGAPLAAYLQGSFLAILGATLLAILAVRMLTRRLEVLERGVARVARGELDVELDPGPLDEIGTLIRNFNEMTRALRIAQDELASQDASRRELLADVSHELRTPLTGLLCQLEGLAEQSGELPPHLVVDLEAALVEAQAVRQRVEDLLLLAREDLDELPLEPEPTNLQRMVQRLVDALRPGLEARRLSLTTEFHEEIVEVPVDSDRIGQVVRNLVSNAAQALGDAGRITVRVRPRDGGALLEVEDDGPGVPLEEQATIFERFQRGEGRTGAGTGLGLAIVKRLVERHGGTVELVSTPGEGARFEVWLPGD